MIRWIGVDFGSKRAGTTALCFSEGDHLQVLQSIKGEDADRFIRNYVHAFEARYVFIDAPLSLPAGLADPDSEEVFYRQADRLLQAMSPMFLGGLTSRAMLLKKQLQKEKVEVFEVYPKALSDELKLKTWYKKDLQKYAEELQPYCPELPAIRNWHQMDASLAWLSGKRFLEGNASRYGEDHEGIIYV